MVKKWVLASVAVFVAWSVMDFIIHGVLLASTYEVTAQLWRPMAEMKMGLMYIVTAVSALAFAGLYAAMAANKSVSTGALYGLLFGIPFGVSMGLGTYTFTPIPLFLAVAWIVGTLVEMIVGGVIVGAIVKPQE
jgi:hypothetical protein